MKQSSLFSIPLPRILAFICILFVGTYVFFLEHLPYNYDEGVHIQQLELMKQGQQPFRDFFYHQPPLLLYTLWGLSPILPSSVLGYRLPSLLITCFTGILIFKMALQWFRPSVAVLSLIFFFFSLLQKNSLLVLPNSFMLFFSTLGIYALFFKNSRRWTLLAGSCFALSIIYKPLSVSTLLLVLCLLAMFKEYRHKWLPFSATGLLTGLLGWLCFHFWSGGLFTELLQAQFGRYSNAKGFEIMKAFKPFRDMINEHYVSTALGWNVMSHIMAFFRGFLFSNNFWLLVFATLGLRLLWKKTSSLALLHKLLISGWWLLAACFSLFLWEPSWEHYYIQYLPVMSVLAAFWVQNLQLDLTPKRILQGTIIGCFLFVHFYSLVMPPLIYSYNVSLAHGHQGRHILNFDPFSNYKSRTVPACGLIDPFNTYGLRNLGYNVPVFKPLMTTPNELIQCLDENPDILIIISRWFFYFADHALVTALKDYPPERIYYTSDDSKSQFEHLKKFYSSEAPQQSKLDVGAQHRLDITPYTEVTGQGNNRNHQLGNALAKTIRNSKTIKELSNISSVHTSSHHSLALDIKGQLWAWGLNHSRQLGTSEKYLEKKPVLIEGLPPIQMAQAASWHSIAVSHTGDLWFWGDNRIAQLANATFRRNLRPIQMEAPTHIKHIHTTAFHNVALDLKGQTWAWGDNTYGQIGVGHTSRQWEPVTLPKLGELKDIQTGYQHTLALKEDGSVWVWGSNSQGQLGLPGIQKQLTPVRVPMSVSIKQIAAGSFHNLALDQDGHVWQWGTPVQTEIQGDAKTVIQIPTLALLSGDIQSIQAGHFFSMATAHNEKSWVWGNNEHQQAHPYQPVVISKPVFQTPLSTQRLQKESPLLILLLIFFSSNLFWFFKKRLKRPQNQLA